MLPESEFKDRIISLARVVLPDPDSPARTRISPLEILKLILSIICIF